MFCWYESVSKYTVKPSLRYTIRTKDVRTMILHSTCAIVYNDSGDDASYLLRNRIDIQQPWYRPTDRQNLIELDGKI